MCLKDWLKKNHIIHVKFGMFTKLYGGEDLDRIICNTTASPWKCLNLKHPIYSPCCKNTQSKQCKQTLGFWTKHLKLRHFMNVVHVEVEWSVKSDWIGLWIISPLMDWFGQTWTITKCGFQSVKKQNKKGGVCGVGTWSELNLTQLQLYIYSDVKNHNVKTQVTFLHLKSH